jgi:hypothetical protein
MIAAALPLPAIAIPDELLRMLSSTFAVHLRASMRGIRVTALDHTPLRANAEPRPAPAPAS